MKKIKIFIIAYNATTEIDNTLTSLFSGNFSNHNVEVYIINNHSNFYIKEEFNHRVRVIHNAARPDFSRGHLARNWNQALINGFKDLNNPDCDIVVCCQDDTVWHTDSIEKLVNIHEKYSFYTCTYGDGFCSYTPDAVKKIGLWDERFSGICFQEADYFFRAQLYNNQRSSINDSFHGRTLNPTYDVAGRNNIRDRTGLDYIYDYALNLFKLKWPNHSAERWGSNNCPPEPSAITNFVLYPYFEKDIELDGKNYFPLNIR
jgi:hypothetical protein